jgi:hypothetical protein
MLESQLHFISAILILFAAIVPIYLTIRLKSDLRKLVLILTIFILVHSIYHIVGFFGLTMLAEAVFEPLSVAILIYFGIIYYELAIQKIWERKIWEQKAWQAYGVQSPCFSS